MRKIVEQQIPLERIELPSDQARLRMADGQFSDTRRSVAALMSFLPAGYPDSYHILRWYDDVWVR